MNPLKSAMLKAEWARQHLNALQAEVASVFGPKLLRVSGEFDAQERRHVFRREVNNPPFDQWALRIGNIATDLRSSLDHIAFQLALQSSPQPGKVYFPIFRERTATYAKSLRFFKPDAVELIDRFQPHNASELGLWPDAYAHPLWCVSEISRLEKHIQLSVIPLTAGWNPREFPVDMEMRFTFDEASVIVELTGVFDPEEELKPEISLEPGIELTQGNTVYHFSFAYLSEAHKLIAERVIPAFSRILPETIDPT